MGRKRGIYAGWYAEIPKELKQRFQELYPGRRSVRLFTIAFVSWAVRVRPDLDALVVKWANGEIGNEENLNEAGQLRTGSTPDVSGKVPPAN